MIEPSISVLLQAPPDATEVERAVRSLRAQTFGNWELLIAVRGARGGAAGERERLAAEDGRIRVLPMADDRGAGSALNFATSKARGELVTYLDADAELAPDFLERVVGFHEPFDVLVCGYEVVVESSSECRTAASN